MLIGFFFQLRVDLSNWGSSYFKIRVASKIHMQKGERDSIFDTHLKTMKGVFVLVPRVASRLMMTWAKLYKERESNPKFNQGSKSWPKG